MAKLGIYYGLCPLIDQRNLLGVNKDVETGNAVVTLGKNIAIKYRLSDQKQIHSWRTKDKFSSPIIYDWESEQYVAVFNQVYVRMWKGDEEDLDKLKKYKFNKPIHTLVEVDKKSFVVFKNGEATPLKTAVDNRKETTIENSDVVSTDIVDIMTLFIENEIFITILLETDKNLSLICHTFQEDKHSLYKTHLTRDNPELSLSGQVLCQLECENQVCLLTLWSDGRLFSYPLQTDTEITPQIESPGNLFAILESLSCKEPVTMAFLNHHYVAMYGAASNQEGATLILYNTQFKVSQSRQALKLFTSGAKLWKIDSNLLFCVGQNLAVIPFCLDTEQLAALVGSHREALNDLDLDITVVEELEVATWQELTEEETEEDLVPNKIKSKVTELLKQGLSEAVICEEILPEYLESNNVQAITNCLDYFKDIPESYLVKILKFCLNANSKLFKSTQKRTSNDIPTELQPSERCDLLNKILMYSFNDIFMLLHLQIELDVSCTLLLLRYICYLMSENSPLVTSNVTETEAKLIEWSCLLLDANYQKLLLSKDPAVLEILLCYNKLVDKHLDCLENLRQVAPLLRAFKQGKNVSKTKQMANLKYSIEQLSLY